MTKSLLGSLELNRIYQRDCLEGMRMIPEDSIDLIVIDPPYNIGKDKRWDKWSTVDDYVAFMSEVFTECERVLNPTGSFYWFHNDTAQVRKLMDALDKTSFVYKNFIVWNKRYNGSPRKYYFDNVIKTESSRSYRPLTEYCLFYTFQKELTDVTHDVTKFVSLREYAKQLLDNNRLTLRKVNELLGHRKAEHFFYWKSTQWELCTQETYNELSTVMNIERSYDDLKKEYESLRQEYESQRYTYNHQKTHHDVWDYEVAPKQGHITPKPVELIENIIRHSSNEGDIVLDCFMGSGTTAVAATRLHRNFIGFEREPEYVQIANQRLEAIQDTEAEQQLTQGGINDAKRN